MFGDNPIRKQVDDDKLWVQSIFYTLQGEGPFAGTPAVFIRLAGCNLRCWWCDTEFESGFQDPDNYQDVATIARQALDLSTPCDLVVLTGGEPLRQNVGPLMDKLLDMGFRVQVETAGTVMPDDVPLTHPNLYIVCSPKTPKLHKLMVHAAAWKYIIRADDVDDADGLPIESTQTRGLAVPPARPTNSAPVFVSPCDEYDPAANQRNLQAAARACLEYGYRLTTQLHKGIGLP